MSPPPGLLPIARQMHAALLHEVGHAVEIERLVSDGRYARDVLLVCDASPDPQLRGLALAFRGLVAQMSAGAAADPPAMPVPQTMLERAMDRAAEAPSGPATQTGAPPSSGAHPVAPPPALLPPSLPARPAPPAAAKRPPASWWQRLSLGWRRR